MTVRDTFSDFERLEKVERNNKQIYDRTISKNKRLKGRKGIKRPYSAKIREPAFKDVNEFKNIIKEEKTILEPEKLFENEWTPYKSGDYIAKHFIRNMEPQYYPTPKKLLRDDFIISS
uniref:Uncharacterized protein n=1 Tax=Parastrongyloides trichosuri TaxID=131310 RepID=A0A0N5A410_PARTI